MERKVNPIPPDLALAPPLLNVAAYARVSGGREEQLESLSMQVSYKCFLGYENGEDGKPKIVESEAKIVRLINKLFLEGLSLNAICKRPTDSGVLTPAGKRIWSTSSVESILTNEKYKGEALLQKKFTVNFLTKEKKLNSGELQRFHVEYSHPAIIEQDVFDMV